MNSARAADSRRGRRCKDRDADPLTRTHIKAVDALSAIVSQPDCVGPQCKRTLLARLNEGEAAGAASEEISGAGCVGQMCRSAGEKDQARLLVAGARRDRIDATGAVQ